MTGVHSWPVVQRPGPAAQRSGRLAAAAARLGAIAALAMLTTLAGCGALTRGGAPAAGPAPIADRPITLNGACSQTEDDGFREQAVLTVDANRVDALSWQIWVGKRGTCRFELAEFRQRVDRAARARRQRLQADGLAGSAADHAGARGLRAAMHAGRLRGSVAGDVRPGQRPLRHALTKGSR